MTGVSPWRKDAGKLYGQGGTSVRILRQHVVIRHDDTLSTVTTVYAADRATYPAPEFCYKLTVGFRGLDGWRDVPTVRHHPATAIPATTSAFVRLAHANTCMAGFSP